MSMGFLAKIEAMCVEAGVTVALKPIKLNHTKYTKTKGKKPKSPKAPSTLKSKFAEARQGGEQVGFSELSNTRKLTSFIEKELQLTDPFNFTNDTWARFTKKVAPKLLTALLLDMNVVPRERKAEFARYLERRLRSLSQT
jgi:hypothetical protein